MKKLLIVALTVALLLSTLSLLVLNTAAEENETSFRFGNVTIDLTLIDNLNEGVGNTFQNWGVAASDGEMLKMELGGLPCNDSYNIKTGMLNADTDFTGAVNLVFSVKDNRSDGDIFFSFQPHSQTLAANDGNLFTGWVEGQTVWLVEENGKATEAKKCPSLDLMSGRAGYVLPMGFEGYIVFPIANFVVHGDWSTSYYQNSSDLDIDGLGFHISKDDATYAELSFDDFFTCGALPAYEKPTPETKPAETDAPATEPETTPATEPETLPETDAPATEPETAAPETVAETEPETTPVETQPDTSAETQAESKAETKGESETEASEKDGGCGGVLSGLCVLPLALLGAVALRRRED